MQQMNDGLHPEVIPPEARGGSFWDLFRMNPHKFHGGLDPMKAHGWVTNI